MLTDFEIDGPEAAASLYRVVRRELAARLEGHAHAIARLTLAAVDLCRGHGTTLTLIGPSGSGKTAAGRATAEILGCGSVLIDCLEMAETSWSGTTVSDYLGELHRAAALRCGPGATAGEVSARMARSVIIIDEAHHLGFVDGVSNGSDGLTRAFRVGRQTSLMPLLEGNVPLHYSPTGGTERTAAFRSGNSLRIVCGAFTGLDGRPTPEALRRYGLQTEFVERLGEVLIFEVLPASAQVRVLARILEPMQSAFATFGYAFAVSPEALRYAAGAVARGAGGTRAAGSWLRAAAYKGLESLLDQDAPAGTTYELAPDAVELPRSSTPVPPRP